MILKDTVQDLNTTLGSNWNVIIFDVVCNKAGRILETIINLIPEKCLAHFTIRANRISKVDEITSKTYYIISLRFLKDTLELERRIHNELTDLVANLFVDHFEWNATIESKWYPYHAWIEPGKAHLIRDVYNCSLLHDLSKISLQLLKEYNLKGRVEAVHLFANMMGIQEDVKTKYVEQFKRPIIGPSYSPINDKEEDDIGIYYHQEGRYEKIAFNFLGEITKTYSKLFEEKNKKEEINVTHFPKNGKNYSFDEPEKKLKKKTKKTTKKKAKKDE